MKLLIVLPHRFKLWNPPAWLAGKLRADFPDLGVAQLPNYDAIREQLADTDILVTRSLRSEQVPIPNKLRWIHSPAAAVHLLMIPEIVHSEIVVTNSREINGVVVAEHVLAQIFVLAKCLPQAVREQQRHKWAQADIWAKHPKEIAGSTLGLIGLGAIGREVAQRGKALSMRVLAVREDTSKPAPPGVDRVLGVGQFGDLLAESDYVVLAVPLTPQTQNLIAAPQLALMKPSACLINVGRGPVVDENALVDALRAGRLRGAALDVFAQEPLAADSPLWDLENVLITPHTAGLSERYWERQYELLKDNLQRFHAGSPMLSIVDKVRGY
jgi:D-2-hydroxyacid dehydrogenase (NADP+)